jgi:hypothetical protein
MIREKLKKWVSTRKIGNNTNYKSSSYNSRELSKWQRMSSKMITMQNISYIK